MTSELLLFRYEAPTERRFDAEDVEVIGRHHACSQPLRLAAGQVDKGILRGEGAQMLERAVLFAVIEEIEMADARRIGTAAKVAPYPRSEERRVGKEGRSR